MFPSRMQFTRVLCSIDPAFKVASVRENDLRQLFGAVTGVILQYRARVSCNGAQHPWAYSHSLSLSCTSCVVGASRLYAQDGIQHDDHRFEGKQTQS